MVTTATRERPIIMGAESVRAIIEGRKTQTRRVAKLTDAGRVKAPGSPKNWHLDDRNAVFACPYGQPGDRLWVRETWHCPKQLGGSYQREKLNHREDFEAKGYINAPRWRSPIFMPRWASRLTLEITDVRVQRLQDIGEDDAIAEGVVKVREGCYVVRGTRQDQAGLGHSAASTAFACAWDELNEARGYGWDANPWVWAVTFRMVA